MTGAILCGDEPTEKDLELVREFAVDLPLLQRIVYPWRCKARWAEPACPRKGSQGIHGCEFLPDSTAHVRYDGRTHHACPCGALQFYGNIDTQAGTRDPAWGQPSPTPPA